ncbi:hematopoietic death receptor [Diretmus argenteus]
MTNKCYKVVVVLIWLLNLTVALRRAGPGSPGSGGKVGSRTQRDVRDCKDNLEYLNGNICCLNCPAGEYVKSPCTTAGEKGKCEECEYGTHTEHSNGLRQCLKCTKCRSDQDIVRECTVTQDTECQCKSKTFCDPHEACEVCKRCSRCEEGEVTARNCTPVSNTDCLANLPTEERQNGENQRLNRQAVRAKPSVSMEDERRGLWDSLASSTTNSQCSLTGLPSPSPASSPQPSPVAPRQSNTREDDPLPKLVPVNGEESLRKSFEYFEELDVDYHKRFFRYLGISDNLIKSKDPLNHEDRLHELLNVWMEMVGKDASLNNLLKALLVLNQRLTAQNIAANAIGSGHYVCEKE